MATPAPDVFLSYARGDGEAFATALQKRVNRDFPELFLWRDRPEIEGGTGWWAQIEAALSRVKVLIVVLTPGALASEITRREWQYARRNGISIYPVNGAAGGQLDHATLPRWLRKLHIANVGRLLDGEWQDSEEWRHFATYLTTDRRPTRVLHMAPEPGRHVVRRDREFDRTVHLLLESFERSSRDTIVLQGGGGYGKTTLASAACHDTRVKDAFDDGILWVTLGQRANLLHELTKLYEAIAGTPATISDIDQLAAQIADRLEHRDCLLVIDDVWHRRDLQPLLRAGRHCTRLLTTRRFDVVEGAMRVTLYEMARSEAIAVLSTGFERSALDDRRLAPLAHRLGDWPLLLGLVTSLVRLRIERGDSAESALSHVERALDRRGVTAFDRDDTSQRNEAVRRTVNASLDELTPADVQRFREIAIFPEEIAVPLTTIGRLWSLDDFETEECVRRLDNLSLMSFLIAARAVTVHDVMREYLLREIDEVAKVHARLVLAYGDAQRLPDAYAWRWLPYHMLHAEQTEDMRQLLHRPEWLYQRLQTCGPHIALEGFQLLHDNDSQLLRGALRLSVPVLALDATQFAVQLTCRMPAGVSEATDAFREGLVEMLPETRLRPRWVHLVNPLGPLVQAFGKHNAQVFGAVESSERIVSWSQDKTLRVWDLTTGEGLILEGHRDAVWGVQLLYDGSALSRSADHTLRLWNLTSSESRVLAGHQGAVRGAIELGNRRILSWSDDATLRLWELDTDRHHVLAGHASSVRGALLMADGQVLSWSHDHALRVFDLNTHQSRELTAHDEPVRGVRLLTENRAISWGDDHSGRFSLRVWNLTTGEMREVVGHEGGTSGVLPLADGRVLSWTYRGTVWVWDPSADGSDVLRLQYDSVAGALSVSERQVVLWANDGTLATWNFTTGEARRLTGHWGRVNGALLVPDGRVLSWSSDSSLRLWDLETGTSQVLTGHEGQVNGARLVAHDRALSWGRDGMLRLWRLNRQHQSEESHAAAVDGIELLPHSRRAVTWAEDCSIRLWDLETGASRTLQGHDDIINGVVVTPDETVVSWSDDTTLHVWPVGNEERPRILRHEGRVTSARLLSDGRLLAWNVARLARPRDLAAGVKPNANSFGGASTPVLWNLETGESRMLHGHSASMGGALPLSGGRLLTWSDDGTLRVWDLSTYESHALRPGHGLWIRLVRLLSDGYVLSSDDRTCCVSNLATGETTRMPEEIGRAEGVVELPHSRVLLWCDDPRLWLWDFSSGGPMRTLIGHEANVRGVLALPDGQVASWCAGGTLRLWSLETGESRLLANHGHHVRRAQPLRDADPFLARFLSFSDDGTVRIGDAVSGEARLVVRHASAVLSATLLPHDRVLSWSGDCSVRLSDLTGRVPSASFFFDAAPRIVRVDNFGGLVVGDEAGRIHFLDLDVKSPASR